MMINNKFGFFYNNRFQLIILFLIFITAFFLRIIYLSKGAITFAYDQARDAFIVQEILNGDFKILGPSVSGVPGLYHGVLYYYVITPAYLIGNGDPIFVSFWLAFINSLFVFIIFYLAKRMTGNIWISLCAALLFAVSFEQSQYAVWLSNPAMGVWFVTLLYTGLYLWIKEKRSVFLAIAGLSYGLSIQSNFSLAYHLIPISIWLWFTRKFINGKQLILFSLSFLFAILSMVLVEFKFGFKFIDGFGHLLFTPKTGGLINNLLNFIYSYISHMGIMFSNNLTPSIPVVGGIVGFGIVFIFLNKLRNIKYTYKLEICILFTWIFSYLAAAVISGTNIPHITSGIGVGFILLITLLISEMYKKNKHLSYLFLACVVLANLFSVVSENHGGQTIFAIQADMNLTNEIAVIDYTYERSLRQPFSINTLTSPLFVNTTWSYLYNWYGIETYGYLPFWRGRNQVGLLGNNLKESEDNKISHFYIIEDMTGIPSKYLTYGLGEENSRSFVLEEKKFGEITVQKRQLFGDR